MHQELNDRRRTRVLEDLRNDDPVTRRTAAWLAARLSIAEAEVLLVERLCTDQSDVRAAAAFALGELRVPRTIPALIAALEHGDFDVRSTAGWALVRFGEQAIPPLVQLARMSLSAHATDMALLTLERIPHGLECLTVNASASARPRAEAPPTVANEARRQHVIYVAHGMKGKLQPFFTAHELVVEPPPELSEEAREDLEQVTRLGRRIAQRARLLFDSAMTSPDTVLRTPAFTRELRRLLTLAQGTLAPPGPLANTPSREVREVVDLVDLSIHGLLELVDGLERRWLPSYRRPHEHYRPRSVFDRASRLLISMVGAREIEPLCRVSPGIPEWVVGDELLLELVLDNLITNAVKYTERGEIEVSLGLEGEQLVVTVRDTGRGIAPADVPRALTCGGSDPTTRAAGSDGVGLSTVVYALEEVHGRLEVRSQPQQGSTFIAFLPIARARPRASLPRD